MQSLLNIEVGIFEDLSIYFNAFTRFVGGTYQSSAMRSNRDRNVHECSPSITISDEERLIIVRTMPLSETIKILLVNR